MNGAQLLAKALKDAGVKYLFGYTGGAIMPFYDEMEKDDGLKHIMARNEQGATFIAQGLSRASISTETPQIGCCLATSGPGATNLITGVGDAMMDSVPIMSITGQVSTGVIGTDAFQETDVVGIMLPITKQVYMPTDLTKIEETIHEAMYIAKTGRPGPVHIDIPKNIQQQEVTKGYSFDYKKYEPYLPGYKYHPIPDNNDIESAIELINKSQRPVIFCGHGVVLSNSGKDLLKFAEKINAPIASTIHGISAFPADHPMHLGWMGMHGTVEANRAIQNCDLIISFGMRFDDRVTGKLDEYAKHADVIHVEIDPSEIDKNVRTTVAVNADVKEAIKAFMTHKKLKKAEHKPWFNQIAEFKKETGEWHAKELENGYGAKGKLLMKTIITKLSKVTGGKDLIVTDVGQHQMITAKYYNFQTTNSLFLSGGAGTMGCSLPMSIGVKLARPDETVWSISGDGGFQMNIQELGAVMEHNIDVKIVILNNHFLGMVKQWQTLFFDGRFAGTPMLNPKYGKIAEAYGIPYMRIEKVEDIENAFETARNHKGAYILEFECDASEIVLPMIPSGARFEDMIVNPK
jgi:acetolactate synthase-1/2/3 large subunit